ncbi:hypothetical protein HETIRDRAFT_429704 [Heterobasidion irregulare TC 32-1]|uniref:Uncharacterized protein n=1 Tax=Heterobasidion irregulare (strain TC 32-1) TaxID=747525 RepID=W4JVD4_HETIT|nr:uncharacterized protein HETIRDRAFT_429704 [Heterobasidion irregulare TC 32-1]ETW77502.1 hypothetical protein HETIRDRAFT_429704 [Heterobasidion irregulare TC 32-1]
MSACLLACLLLLPHLIPSAETTAIHNVAACSALAPGSSGHSPGMEQRADWDLSTGACAWEASPGFSLRSRGRGTAPHIRRRASRARRRVTSRRTGLAACQAARTFVPYEHAHGTVIGSQPSRRYVVSTYKYKYTLATGPFAIADALTERCSAEATLSTQCRGGTIEVTIWKAQK